MYISKRPVVANIFQIGGDEAASFFVATDEAIANAIMDNRNASSNETAYISGKIITSQERIFEYIK